MSVRKMITFPERGAELLAEATGGARERAAGEYLSAVLTQRRRAWARALDELSGSYPLAEISRLLKLFHERGYGHGECVGYLPSANLGHLVYDLLLEYDAGNHALLEALSGPAE